MEIIPPDVDPINKEELTPWEDIKKELDNLTPIEKTYHFLLGAFMRFMDVRYNIKKIVWFFSRGKNGWAPCDTWSLDSYLSSWMPEAVRYLKKNKNGFPSNLSSDKEWEDILEKIALGFEATRKQDDLVLGKEEGAVEEYQKKMDDLEKVRIEGMNLFVEHYNGLWD